MSTIAETAEELHLEELRNKAEGRGFYEPLYDVSGTVMAYRFHPLPAFNPVSICRTCGADNVGGTVDLSQQGCPYCHGY
jgi:hypothetical protein